MFYQTEKVLEGVRSGKCFAFPALRPPIRSAVEAELSDRDGLFVNRFEHDAGLTDRANGDILAVRNQ